MQKLQLSIPEPCHENWQHMTPTQQGRFCNACAKEVVDFSTMTDVQVLHYFSNMTHEKVCGRALPEQLNRAISFPAPPKKKLFRYWNYIAMFFMLFVKGNNGAAQNSTKPATEISPAVDRDIRGKIAVSQSSRIITGKITDTDGNPVPFASVMIKGTKTGVSADANGGYSLRVRPNAILIIQATSYFSTEIPTGTVSVFNTVMERSKNTIEGTIVVGGLISSSTDEYYGPLDRSKRVAVIQVKDETTGKVIPQASLLLQTAYKKTDTVFTDKKGTYKLRGITEYDRYSIQVIAAGFEPAEFTISEHDFAERKKEWEVLLRKEKKVSAIPEYTIGPGSPMLKKTCGLSSGKGAIYIVDGVHMPYGTDINPDDVENYSVLQAPEATALFGMAGANGAVVITTRKAKEIQLKDVTVTTEFGVRRIAGGMTGAMTVVNEGYILKEKIVTFKTLLTDSIKVFPNPVQANSDFSIRLKLKQPGSQYRMLITDAVGKVLLQQKISAATKEHTEKIAADGRWSAGMYYIRIFDTQNNLVSKSSFIYR